MIIEISRKTIVIIVALLVGVAALFGVYTLGYNTGYDSGVETTTKKYENPKGNGDNFYAEKIVENQGQSGGAYGVSFPITRARIVYHSTPNCPSIEYGVKMDVAFLDSAARVNNSSFCPKCMDEKLIIKCQDFLDNFVGR